MLWPLQIVSKLKLQGKVVLLISCGKEVDRTIKNLTTLFMINFYYRDGNLKRNQVKSEWKAKQQEAFSKSLKVE